MSLPPEITDPIGEFVSNNIDIIIISICVFMCAYIAFVFLCTDAQTLVKVRDSIENIAHIQT